MISIVQTNKPFANCKGKTGVYIYFDNDVPVYVGSAGRKVQDLKERLEQYSSEGDSGATLRINICKMDNCSAKDAVEKISKFTIKTIICGRNNSSDYGNVDKLEKILVKLLQPKYNSRLK